MNSFKFTCPPIALALMSVMTSAALASTPLEGDVAAERYLIQADSADEARALALDVGATLTHFLPTISAIGAELTPAQRESLAKSGRARLVADIVVETNGWRSWSKSWWKRDSDTPAVTEQAADSSSSFSKQVLAPEASEPQGQNDESQAAQ
ncbi:MAG: hypothetical protein AAFX85_02775, partial [Pseudomonadota bacterium]